jgi:hypothetical protein
MWNIEVIDIFRYLEGRLKESINAKDKQELTATYKCLATAPDMNKYI